MKFVFFYYIGNLIPYMVKPPWGYAKSREEEEWNKDFMMQ